MAFRVKTTLKADRDLNRILARLQNEFAGEAGLHWFQGMREATASLSSLPERCALALENNELPFEVRQLLYGRRQHIYRILFTIEGNLVVVFHIRHGRQHPLAFH